MLSVQARPYIDASVPVLKAHGLAITTRFYARLFEAHPELKHLFNMGNQANGVQQQSLAAAVFAYAANIDQAQALAPVIERIVHKHASVGLRPEHYPLVGTQLLGAIGDVLGEAATPELIAAWAEAYGLLADTLIAAEARLYEQARRQPGELRALQVVRIEEQGKHGRAFVLQDPAGGSPGAFEPGQYISVSVKLPGGLHQLRQYSLSDAPQQPWWRITVKRETARGEQPAGQVSNHLHDTLKVGDVLNTSAPFGDFKPLPAGDGPLWLLSAGVGITPMVSALNSLVAVGSTRHVVFAHAARKADEQAHGADLRQATHKLPGLQAQLFHEGSQGATWQGLSVQPGRMDVSEWVERARRDQVLDQVQVFLCGPLPFMQAQRAALLQGGVPAANIHREVFGPDLLDGLI
jgi:nitric oxide dioxygenase